MTRVAIIGGGIGGLTAGDIAGGIELHLVPDVSVEWAVDDPFEAPQFSNRQGEIPLTLHRPAGDVELSRVRVVLVRRKSAAERRLVQRSDFRVAGRDTNSILFVRRS